MEGARQGCVRAHALCHADLRETEGGRPWPESGMRDLPKQCLNFETNWSTGDNRLFARCWYQMGHAGKGRSAGQRIVEGMSWDS